MLQKIKYGIPENIYTLKEFLFDDFGLQTIRDYVLHKRGEDISVELYFYQERVFSSPEFCGELIKIIGSKEESERIYRNYCPDESVQMFNWNFIRELEEYSDGLKIDKREVKKAFLIGWLNVQLWDHGLQEKQKIYQVRNIPKTLRNSDRKDHFFYGESIQLSIDAMKNFWKKYLKKRGVRKSKISFINRKLSVTDGNAWHVFVTSKLKEYYYNNAFILTEQSFDKLKKEGIPEDIINELKSLENKKYISKEKFAGDLIKKITEKQTVEYKSLILKHSKEGTKNEKSAEFPPVPGEMITINCLKDTESTHAATANYISWQEYLYVKDKERKKTMEREEPEEKEPGENTVLKQIENFKKEAALDNTPVSDEIKRILRQVATDTRVCELSKDDQNIISQASETSPRIRMLLRMAQRNYIRLKIAESAAENQNKELSESFFERLKRIVLPTDWAGIFPVYPKSVWVCIASGAATVCLLIILWASLAQDYPLPSLINESYKTALLQKISSENASLPWETDNNFSFAPSNRDAPVYRAFGAGLWGGRNKLMPGSLKSPMPDFLSPGPDNTNIKADQWAEKPQLAAYFWIGQWCFLMKTVCESGIEMQDSFWDKQSIVLNEIQDYLAKHPHKTGERINNKLERIKPYLEELSRYHSKMNQDIVADIIEELIDVFKSVG